MIVDLADADHLVWHIISSRRDGDVANAEGFCLRPDESALSVNRLETFVCDKRFQLAEVRRLCRLEVRRSGCFAELEIGTVRKKVLKECVVFRIMHDPLDATDTFDADPSHAGMEYLPRTDSPEDDAGSTALYEPPRMGGHIPPLGGALSNFWPHIKTLIKFMTINRNFSGRL